jgi:hypothetical protein
MTPWPTKRHVLLKLVLELEKQVKEIKREIRGHKRGDGMCTGCGINPAVASDTSNYCASCRKLAKERAEAAWIKRKVR